MSKSSQKPERFMQLYAANQRRIFGFIRTLVFTHADAEDLTQETVSILWRKFDQFEQGTDFGAWAIRVAHFEILNRARRRSTVSVFEPEVLARLADEAMNLAEHADARRHALHDCIDKLPDDHRDLLRRHYDDAQPVKTIADNTGRSERTIYRTLQQMHDALYHCIRRTLAE